MTSTLKSVEQDINRDISQAHLKIETELNKAEDTAKELGQYVLYGFITGTLLFVPFANFLAQKIPEAAEIASKFIP